MRPTWLLVLAACAEPASVPPTPASDPPQAPQAPAITRPPAPAYAWPEKPKAASQTAPVTLARGSHGLPIVSVALAEDGTAALTVDSGHHARLWPALDGTREPVVVPVQTPLALAVERAHGELVTAVLDTAGGITILRVDDGDRLVGRAVVTAEATYADVFAAGDGFVALRADHTIELLDVRGSSRGVLSPPPGRRVVALLHRRGRTLALTTGADGVQGRWIELAGGRAQWGASTPKLDIDPATAVLSPDHVHLAAIQTKPHRTAIFDLTTGEAKLLRGAPVPLGFVADDRLAVARMEFDFSVIQWWDLSGTLRGTFGDNFELDFIAVRPTMTADDRVVSFFEEQLVLIAPKGGLRYLGYSVHTPSRLRGSALGMVAGLGGAPTLLDASLRADRRVPAPDGAIDTAVLDDDHAVMLVGAVDTTLDDDWIDPALVKKLKRGRWIELVQLSDKKRVQKLSFSIHEPRLHYEPTTRLLGAKGGEKVTFARYSATAGRFDEPITVRLDADVRELALVDPALAGGDVAIVAHAASRATVVRRFGADLQPREAVTVPGTLEAIDRAGHLYVRDTPDTITIHGADRTLGRLEGLRGWKLRPSPDGREVVAFGRGRILLASVDGTTRWAIGFPSLTDLQWSPTGELIALSSGLARLDPNTGAIVGAQCGWRFALRTEPANSTRQSSICDR